MEKNTGFNRMLASYVGLSHRHPFALTAAFLLVTILCFIPISNLKIVKDFENLLPQDTDSVKAMKESRKRVGSSDLYTIAVESPDVRANVAFLEALRKEIVDTWPEVEGRPHKVQIQRETTFFKKHALLYIPMYDLEDLRDLLEIEICKVSNTCPLDWGEEDSLESWYDPDLVRRLGLPQQVGRELASFFGIHDDDKRFGNQKKSTVPKDLTSYMLSPDGRIGMLQVYLDKPSTNLDYAKEVLLRGEDAIKKAGLICPPAGGLCKDESGKYNAEMIAEVVGPYRSFKEADQLVKDATQATLISVVAILLIMILFFRNFRSVLLVMIPLTVTCIWAMAATQIVYGRLTMLTIFLVAMIYGMGIDYGIHLYSRTLLELRRGKAILESMTVAEVQTGRAMVSATVTTVAAMMLLLVADFKGFFEFGIVASIGVALATVVFLGMLPPLVFIGEKIVSTRVAPMKGEMIRDRLFLGIRMRHFYAGTAVIIFLMSAAKVFGLGSVEFEYDFRNLRGGKSGQTIHYGQVEGDSRTTTPGVILGGSEKEMRAVHRHLEDVVTMEREKVRNLEREGLSRPMIRTFGDPEKRLEIERPDWTQRMLAAVDNEKTRQQLIDQGWPVELFDWLKDEKNRKTFSDPAWKTKHLEEMSDALERAKRNVTIKSFVSVATFVPDKDRQEERMELIEEIEEILQREALKKVKGKSREIIEELETMTDVEPFTIEKIPAWAIESIRERDREDANGNVQRGQVGTLGYVYADLQPWDAIQVRYYQDTFGFLPVRDMKNVEVPKELEEAKIPVAASGFILADVIRLVEIDGKRLATWVAFVVFLILLFDLRNFRWALLCFSTIALGSLWTLAMMGILDVKVGMYNLIVIPVILGAGIDGAIHIFHRYRELNVGQRGMAEAMMSTGVTVAASSLTDMAGFAGLMFIPHKGLNTIGELAVLGIGCCLLASLIVTPWAIRIFYKEPAEVVEAEK